MSFSSKRSSIFLCDERMSSGLANNRIIKLGGETLSKEDLYGQEVISLLLIDTDRVLYSQRNSRCQCQGWYTLSVKLDMQVTPSAAKEQRRKNHVRLIARRTPIIIFQTSNMHVFCELHTWSEYIKPSSNTKKSNESQLRWTTKMSHWV
jgi:hypothetical protein